tara:strand:+ start:1236 stop:2303 length:1068 start_codon:yes stop_codon:yes gene_type:complete
MENFVIIRSENFRAKSDFEQKIDDYLMSGQVVCVWGGSGVGKTYSCNRVLQEHSFVDINCDITRSKRCTQDMLKKIAGTSSVLFFDDVLIDCPGFTPIADFIENQVCITGPVLFTIRDPTKFKKYFKDIEIKYLELSGPNKRFEIISAECMEKFGLKVGKNDDFYSTRDNIVDLICKGGRGYERFLGQGIEEHGHNADLIFSNYNCDTIKDAAIVSDSLSRSDVLDDKIYEGNWDFLPYFTLHSCVIPSMIVGNKTDPADIRPGTSWTKLYNQKMREKHFGNMKSRVTKSNVDVDFISYFMRILLKMSCDEMKNICISYGIRSQDIDFMNHLVFTKLKGKALNTLKKHLKHHAHQ